MRERKVKRALSILFELELELELGGGEFGRTDVVWVFDSFSVGWLVCPCSNEENCQKEIKSDGSTVTIKASVTESTRMLSLSLSFSHTSEKAARQRNACLGLLTTKSPPSLLVVKGSDDWRRLWKMDDGSEWYGESVVKGSGRSHGGEVASM